MKPDFDKALNDHFDAITNRDMEAFKSHLTSNGTMYTIIQNGHAFTSPNECNAIHEQWFRDPRWIWEGKVVHKHVGNDMAFALVKYRYHDQAHHAPLETWLTYVFALEDGAWKIIHDHNTALDFHAFEKTLLQDGD